MIQPDWSGDLEVIEVSDRTAWAWVKRWHYSRRLPAGGYRFGVFAPDMLALVIVGPGANMWGVAKRLDLSDWPGNWEITRVVVHARAPKNSASKAVAAVLHHIHRAYGLDWVFSYADPEQGHHGGIYQALNAVYVGTGSTHPYRYDLDGRRVHHRSVYKRFGSETHGELERRAAEQGHVLVRHHEPTSAKHTYVLLAGGPAARRQIREHLSHQAVPYPK